jgi:ligand-binding sensor domain-containing protein
LATLPSLAGMTRAGNSVLLCKDNGDVFQLVTDARTGRAQLSSIFWKKPESLSSCQLHVFSGEQSLWLLSNEGMRRTGWQDKGLSTNLNFARFGESNDADQPASNLISALAFDDLGNLWAGSFRNGIDVFTREGRRLTHLESDAAREINALAWDAATKQMLAATSHGLVRFSGFRQTQNISAADGLLSNSILYAASFQTSSSASSANLVLATSRGLAFGRDKQWRALTAVQGLPSNSVYAVLPHREFVYVGTLSGLAQINSGRVVRTFKDSNSKLTHNWVTSLCAVGNRLFVGTYGGGVFELTPSGEFVSFASDIGKQSVNPNAMATDGQRLYVGTLEGAWVLDLESAKWRRLKRELPASAVLSVVANGDNVYFGTTSGIARLSKNHFEPVTE